MTAETTEWAGPARFLPPPEPARRDDGALHYVGRHLRRRRSATGRCSWTCGCRDRRRPPPLVVWIHGGGFMIGDRRYLPETLRPDQVFDALLAAGLAVATIDYRHALEAPFPAQLHDAKAAVRYLRAHADELGISTERIGVMGRVGRRPHRRAASGLTAHRPDLEGTHGVVGPVERGRRRRRLVRPGRPRRPCRGRPRRRTIAAQARRRSMRVAAGGPADPRARGRGPAPTPARSPT